MAPRFFSSRGRYIFGGTACATACVLVPPKETLPSSLLPPRVMLEGVGRVARCAMVGGQLYMDYALSVGPNNSQDEWDEVHIRAAHRLVRLAETNGGLYVKAGQIFANMSHILPLHYCRIMAVLQDAVVKRPFSEVQAVLEAEYGVGDVHGIFDVIDETPIAAASLAQVHRGHLRREDVEVAIKVQYIDIRQRFLGDMLTIQAMLGVAGWLFPGYDLGQIINKLNDTVAAELDFRIEARNCARAAEDLRRGGFGDRVVCTTVCEGYTTPRVLITRFVDDAVKINDAVGMLRRGINPKEAATFFYDAMAYQIFTTGFFHGDPHAGNVLVHRSPSTGRTQVVLLDFGLCGDLSSQHKLEMSQIWASSVAHDDATLEKIARRYDCTDYALFASCFLQHPYIYYAAGAGPSGHGGKVSMEQARESMRETMKNKMSEVNAIVAAFPKEYALVLRCIMATKAINKELGEVVNRPLRFLRYALPNANSTHSVKVYYTTMLRAWWMETWSRWALFFLQWFDPTLAAELEQRTNPTAAM